MDRKIGDTIHDPSGNEWIIAYGWEWEGWQCFVLISRYSPDILGGLREYRGENYFKTIY